MATPASSNKPMEQPRSNAASRKRKVAIIATIAGLLLLALVVVWHIHLIAAARITHRSAVATGVVHTAAEAVQAVTVLYRDYLPLKAETVSKVGNNPLLEPALVQVLRASEDEFSPDLYGKMLDDYMKEYQSSGKVTKDEVACVSNAVSASSVALSSTAGTDAIINATLNLDSGNSLLVPVTMDLTTLTVKKIACP